MRGAPSIGLAIALAACGRIDFDPLARDGALRCTPSSSHDEDADGLTDGCDPCPHVADIGLDMDGDGVGDACDPFTAEPSEFYVRFETFTTVPADWDVNTGTVSDGESLPIDTRGAPAWAGDYVMTPTRDVFVLGGTLGARGPGPMQIVSVLMYQGPAKYYCGVIDAGGSSALEITYTYDEITHTRAGEAVLPASPMGPFVLRVEHVLPTIACTVTVGGMNYQVIAQVPLDIFANRIAVNVIDEAASLAYFVQIRTATN